MKILIKNAYVVDPQSPFNGNVFNVVIDNGIITDISKDVDGTFDQIIEHTGLHLSPGWVDTCAHFGEPGYENKETLETGCLAAAAGGFTHVFVMPNTNPCIHNKSGIEFLIKNNRTAAVQICPVGAVTKNCAGTELAEMYDMYKAGAVAFSDGLKSIQSAGLLTKALQYVKSINSTIIQVPNDYSITSHGLMNEGVISTTLGMPGIPAVGEELMLFRDINLARYANSRLHVTGVSTKIGLQYISTARGDTHVSCSVTPFHLFFCDEDLSGYDTNLKLVTPLRTINDKLHLQQAMRNGDIDCIASHHFPHETDSKVTEFEAAEPGSISLETAYAAINTAVTGIEPHVLVNTFAIKPRSIFNMQPVRIDVGVPACITLFNPNEKWVFTDSHIKSRSGNTPFKGTNFIGRVIGIINNNQIVLQHE